MTPSAQDMKRIPLLLLAVVALAAAGCGSSNDNNSSSSSSSEAAPATSTESNGGTAAGGGKTVTIDMKDIQFKPATATVKVGQTVKWVNDDEAPHNITGGPLHSKTFGKGGTFEFTPKKAETISYVCTVHTGMKATLTVTS
jgi:plastocyanin